MVDPIDGTHHFARGEPQWSVMLALVEDGVPVLGVVARPAKDDLLADANDGGAWREAGGTRIAYLPERARGGQLHVAMDSSARAVWDTLARLIQIRPVDAGLIGVMSMFDDDVHAFIALPDDRPFEWDIAAPDAIIRCIGGCLTDIWGRPLQYNRPDPGIREGVVAAINMEAHARLMPRLSMLASAAPS